MIIALSITATALFGLGLLLAIASYSVAGLVLFSGAAAISVTAMIIPGGDGVAFGVFYLSGLAALLQGIHVAYSHALRTGKVEYPATR